MINFKSRPHHFPYLLNGKLREPRVRARKFEKKLFLVQKIEPQLLPRKTWGRDTIYSERISESGDFKNVMKSKCFHLFSFNTYEHNVYIKEFRFFHFQFNPFNNLTQYCRTRKKKCCKIARFTEAPCTTHSDSCMCTVAIRHLNHLNSEFVVIRLYWCPLKIKR